MKRVILLFLILVVVTGSCVYNKRTVQSPFWPEYHGLLFPVDTVGNFQIVVRLESNRVYPNDSDEARSQLSGTVEINCLQRDYRSQPEESMPSISIDSFCVGFDNGMKYECTNLIQKPMPNTPCFESKLPGVPGTIMPMDCPPDKGALRFKYIAVVENPNRDTDPVFKHLEHVLYRIAGDESYVWTTDHPMPNPFSSPIMTIPFFVPKTDSILIVIFDVTGRPVDTLINEVKEAGYFQKRWTPGSALPSGVYFYRVTIGDKTTTKKLVLVR